MEYRISVMSERAYSFNELYVSNYHRHVAFVILDCDHKLTPETGLVRHRLIFSTTAIKWVSARRWKPSTHHAKTHHGGRFDQLPPAGSAR